MSGGRSLPPPFYLRNWIKGRTAPDYYEVLLLIIIVWFLCFKYFKLYESYRKQTLATVLRQAIKAVAAGMVLLFLALYVLKIFHVSRLLLVSSRGQITLPADIQKRLGIVAGYRNGP